jgi:hypothetical protein
VEIARRANYDREHGVPDALDANNPIQATDLRIMHDQELLRRAQYNQDNGPPDGGVPEPRLEFVKSFVPSTFGDVTISCHTLISTSYTYSYV